MDSVNPVILVTAGTAVVGLLAAMSVCMKNSAPHPKVVQSTPKSTPKPATTSALNTAEAPTDAKKKKKPKKKTGSSQEILQDQIQGLEEDEVPSPPSQVNIPPKINIIPQENTGKAKSKAKSPTPVSTTAPVAGTYAAASVAPAPVPAPAPTAVPTPAPSNAKAEKAKSKTAIAPAVAPVAPVAVPKVADPLPVVQKAAAVPVDELAIYRFEAGIDDNSWNVVEDKRKAKFNEKIKQPKPSEKPVATTAPIDSATGTVPAVETTTAQVIVDVKKVGIIIGPKGVTLKAIQEATGAEIQTPKDRDSSKEGNVTITITGPAEGVTAATKIVNDLSSKGYSAALEGEDFSEGFASVHPTHVMELVGKGGSIRKAIQDHTGVRINIPANVSREQTANVKVGLAGVKGKVTEAKKIIKELIKFKHHPVTHPGATHQELDVPSALYNVIIGARGSEIKQIQGNYKVSVHIPNEHSGVQSVLIVGEAKNVESAVKYIHKILEQATRDRTAAVDTAEIWAETVAAQEEEVTEDWMQEFVHPSKRKVTATVPAATLGSSSSATTSTASTGAWGAGVVTAAEGW